MYPGRPLKDGRSALARRGEFYWENLALSANRVSSGIREGNRERLRGGGLL